MADRERLHGSTEGMKQKSREHRVEVGREVPDESKERHTEIAVDAGRKDDKPHGEKH